jgi:hypothetical protein
MAVLYYIVDGVDPAKSASTTYNTLKQTGGKIEVGPDGVEVVFHGSVWWSCKNTGQYDAAGTRTAATYPMYYIYGSGTAPGLTYAGTTTQNDLDTQIVEAAEDVLICPPGHVRYWTVFFKPAAGATNGITIVLRPNESFEG